MKNNTITGSPAVKRMYSVDFAVNGYKSVEVEASSFEEAERLAEQRINEEDFGALEEICYRQVPDGIIIVPRKETQYAG